MKVTWINFLEKNKPSSVPINISNATPRRKSSLSYRIIKSMIVINSASLLHIT